MNDKANTCHDNLPNDHVDRRRFFGNAARILGSLATPLAMLPLLRSNQTLARVPVPPESVSSTASVTEIYETPTFIEHFITFDPARWATHFLNPDSASPDGWQRTLNENKEAEWNVDDAVQFTPNGLILTAKRNAPGVVGPRHTTWTSGMLCQRDTSATGYGYYEAVVKIPPYAGMWAAFWFLAKGGWPPEWDIFEMIGKPTQLFCTPHTASKPKISWPWPLTVPDLSKKFHKFGGLYNSAETSWYLDDKEIGKMQNPPDFIGRKWFALFNLSVGGAGSWPDRTNGMTPASVDQVEMLVRTYSFHAEGSWTGKQIPTTPPV